MKATLTVKPKPSFDHVMSLPAPPGSLPALRTNKGEVLSRTSDIIIHLRKQVRITQHAPAADCPHVAPPQASVDATDVEIRLIPLHTKDIINFTH